jgi:hypothetical protein
MNAGDAAWASACAEARGLPDFKGPSPANEGRLNQRALLREIYGNPFLPVSIPLPWLQWEAGRVEQVAQLIYASGRFEDISPLADTLVRAGCDNDQILAHCRSAGQHVRGCWVLDALLRKS